MCCMRLNLARHQVAHDNTGSLAVLYYQVQHFRPREHFNFSCGNLSLKCLVGAQQQLLASLTTSIKCSRNEGSAERPVG